MQVNLAKGETCDAKHPVKASIWIKLLLEFVKRSLQNNIRKITYELANEKISFHQKIKKFHRRAERPIGG